MAKELWRKIEREINSRVSQEAYEAWFKPLKPLKIKGDKLMIQVPNSMFSEWNNNVLSDDEFPKTLVNVVLQRQQSVEHSDPGSLT